MIRGLFKRLSHFFLLTFILAVFLLPWGSKAGCLEDGKNEPNKKCGDIVCCGGSLSKCEETEMEIFDIGPPPSSTKVITATCIAKGTTDSGAECFKKGSFTGKSCDDIKCCDGFKCVQKKGEFGILLYAECVEDIKTDSEVESPPIKFKPSVTIPGTIFTADKEIDITSESFAQYVSGFYKFFIGFIAVAAVVMIMWGGFKRIMAAGSAEKMKDANETIFAALTGLVITLISYSLLNLINPRLVEFKSLAIYNVKKEVFTSEVDEEIATPPPAVDWTEITKHPNLFLDSDAKKYPYLRKDTNEALLNAAGIAAQEGIIIEVNYAGRTKKEQQMLYNKHCKNEVCKPPTCNPNKKCPHMTGGAVDVVCKGKVSTGPCQSKLQEIMLKAGFCRLISEAWHFEYPHMSSKCSIKK